jgi:putative spermidine/putrescine transport system substrate-binding protein
MADQPSGRRKFLKYAGTFVAGAVLATAATAGYYSSQPPAGQAVTTTAATSVTEPVNVVQWGGGIGDATDMIDRRFTEKTGIPVRLEYVIGGAATVIGKIRAELPYWTRDVVATWDVTVPVYNQEDWAMVLTPENLPAMSQIPELYRFKNNKGDCTGLAFDVTPDYWMYRTDMVPKDLQPITSFDQFFDPRLKHRIQVASVSWGQNASVLSMALSKGGDEHNMDPGWKLLQDLAKAGQIGSVINSEADVIKGMTVGEQWISYSDNPESVPIFRQGIPLVEVKSEKMKGTHSLEGFQVMKHSPRLDLALKYMDFFFTLENYSDFISKAGNAPVIPQVKPAPELLQFLLTPEEAAKFSYVPDWNYMYEQTEAWTKRWESDIAPYL